MAKENENEFDTLDTEDAPVSEFAAVPKNTMIDSGSAGTVYDWTTAPEGVKAPPRIDLNGKTVTIKKAEIILPPLDRKWELTKGGDKEFKYCSFILYYDVDGQQEFYSGMRVFKRENGYSHPTITRDRKNQSSRLLGIYADYKQKDINEIALKEFLGFLNSHPKAIIKTEEVSNPETHDVIRKNFIGSFVNP
jgi:hypothetical protein